MDNEMLAICEQARDGLNTFKRQLTAVEILCSATRLLIEVTSTSPEAARAVCDKTMEVAEETNLLARMLDELGASYVEYAKAQK